MFKIKNLAVVLLVITVVFGQAGIAAAAPAMQETDLISGTIETIVVETDASGVATVLVTLTDEGGATQTVRLSVETAAALGLVTLDPVTQQPVVDESQIGQTVEIDPAAVIPDEEPSEEAVHPIAWLLAEFFGEDPAVIDGYHQDGFGFGVIAQALWISQNLTGSESEDGNASLASEILQAKEEKNFEAFFEAHPEYIVEGEIPTNWGQFKKALLDKKNNLGVIVSGQEETGSSTDPLLSQGQGNGKDKNEKNNKDKKDKKNKP